MEDEIMVELGKTLLFAWLHSFLVMGFITKRLDVTLYTSIVVFWPGIAFPWRIVLGIVFAGISRGIKPQGC